MWSWLANPWMLGLGGLAVSLPILIHLLNKRRFKIVNWAAMDFLFDAEKKNRKRVRLENFILLLLRCLAMLLLGLLLARPFLPSSVTRLMSQKPQYERVLLLDDSLSQNVIHDGLPGLEIAKSSIANFLKQLAENEESDNWVTLVLTSDPEQPLVANEPLTTTTLGSLVQIIDDIEVSDTAADYPAAFTAMNRYVSGQRENTGRVFYLFSDMRARDWKATGDDTSPEKVLQEISEQTAGTFLIDTGGDEQNNVAITNIRPEDVQVANKVVRFNIDVTNYGSSTVNDLRVMLQVNEEPPEYEIVPSISPGETEQVTLRYVFNRMTRDTLAVEPEDDVSQPQFQNFRIRAEIDRQGMTADELKNDCLPDDSQAYFASRVLDGVSVLLVDGEPSAISERSETHYLQSLDVRGAGLDVDTVSIGDFETISLSRYRIIYLCNFDEASKDRVLSLSQWVQDGGALVLMPGNRVQASRFNETFYKNGAGLSPLGLNTTEGDPTMSRWVNFEVDSQLHPAFEIIVNTDSSSLSNVDVFSWWTSIINRDEIGKTISVPLRFNDRDNSPAMAEKSLGLGKVITFAIPADGDWSMWPSSATFAPVMICLIDYLIGSDGTESAIPIGGKIKQLVDLSVYDSRVALLDPTNEKTESVSRPVDESEEAQKSELQIAEFDEVKRRGFYEVNLKRHDGPSDRVLYSANVDSRESELQRVADNMLVSGYFGEQVSTVSPDDLLAQNVRGGETEIWPLVLFCLFAILVAEQTLGWWFGSKR